MDYKSTFSPLLDVYFGEQKDFSLFGGYSMDVPCWQGQAPCAWPSVFHPWSAVH